MRNYSKVLKIAPAFFLAGTIMQAQTTDTIEKEKKIEEVVLIGYGSKKKSDLTGAVTALSEKDFNKGAVVNTQQLLQGKAAGVTIGNDASPGGGSTVRIRGIGTFNGNADPLYVIDGIPLTREGTGGVGNPLNLINPNDIESISVLKDASATAIYGIRASAGVIIIKTKSGSSGKWRFNYSGNVQLNTVMNKYDVYSASELTDIVKNKLPGKFNLLGVIDTSGNQVMYDTNWQDEILQKAWGTAQDFSARGNAFNGKLPMRFSVGYNNLDGILKTSNFERMNASISLTPKLLNDNLILTINAKGTKTKYRYADTGAIGQALAMDPTKPVTSDLPLYQDYGGYTQWLQIYTNSSNAQYISTPQNVGLGNPVATLMGHNNTANIKQFLGSSEIEYKIPFVKGLSAIANLGLEYTESETTTVNQPYLHTINTDNGQRFAYADIAHQRRNNQTLDLYFKYNKNDFKSGVISDLGITGGYTYQSFKNRGDYLKDLNNPDKIAGNYYIDNGVLMSFFTRANISFVDKYILTATVRQEASSKFYANKSNRWATSPSAAFAWKVKNENWLKDNNFISDLKLRLGWGITGNQDISNWYPTVAYYNTVNSGLTNYVSYPNGGNTVPVFISTVNPEKYNPNLIWEKTAQYNMGLDFGLKRRITGSVDYWRKEIDDLLYYSFLPAGANFNSKVDGNIASMNSQGIDVDLNFKIIDRSKTKLDFGFNMGWVDMEISKLNRDGSIDSNVGQLSGLTMNPYVQSLSAGRSPYEYYVYKQAYDSNGKPLEGVMVDMNGDGELTESDKYLTGKSPIADFTFGWNTFLQVGNFDLRTVWRASLGNYAFNNVNARFSTLKYIDSDGFSAINNTITNYSNTGFENAPGTFQFVSDLNLEDASFLKLDNITAGYVFDNFLNTKTKFRFYGSVQNVFTVTKYSGLDPEVGIDWNIFPRARTYTFGVNFDF